VLRAADATARPNPFSSLAKRIRFTPVVLVECPGVCLWPSSSSAFWCAFSRHWIMVAFRYFARSNTTAVKGMRV
jgi:hypothetical protein